MSFSEVIRATPPVLWSWMNEPEKRALYSPEPARLKFVPVVRPNGRTGVGATTHCVHGKNTEMRELVLDWKPFDYYTVEQNSGPMGVIQTTFRLEPLDAEHTRVLGHFKGRLPGLPRFLHRPLIRFIFTRMFNYGAVLKKMKALLEAQPKSDMIPQALEQELQV